MRFRSSLLLALMLVGCAEEKLAPFEAPPPPGESVKSEKSRITERAPQAVFDGVMRGNTASALSLHRKLLAGDENLFFSPLSIQAVAGMLAGGARGDTMTQLGLVLPLSNAADFHRSMNQLDMELWSRGVNSKGAEGEPFAFVRLNQLFLDDQQHVEPAYLDLLSEEYGASVQRLPIRSEPDTARDTVNTWVSQATRGRIAQLFAPDSFNGRTRLALVNAIYFSAGWEKEFPTDVTAPFTKLDGSVAPLTMMKISSLRTTEVESADLQAVSIPYSGRELSLRIVMPKTDFAGFEASLTEERLSGVFGGLQSAEVELTMPPFELRSELDLKAAFEALGVKAPFDEARADFSGISDSLYVDTFVHKAWLQVTKTGTRAAAATGAGAQPVRAPPRPRPIVIDKPFLFFIVDDATGAILFMGRYTKP